MHILTERISYLMAERRVYVAVAVGVRERWFKLFWHVASIKIPGARRCGATHVKSFGAFLKVGRIFSILLSSNTEDRDGPPYPKSRRMLWGIRSKAITKTFRLLSPVAGGLGHTVSQLLAKRLDQIGVLRIAGEIGQLIRIVLVVV